MTVDRIADFEKVYRLGMVDIGDSKGASLYVTVKYNAGRLSITGVEGPLPSGNCRGACGQIDMHPWKFKAYADGWSLSSVRKLRDIWAEWHLNDMQAGTESQRKAIADATDGGWKPDPMDGYKSTCDMLRERGLYVDNGYTYGSAWLRKDVPADVLAWLQSRPDADKAPAWH